MRTGELPTDEDVLGAVMRRGCISLRALCQEFWPELRWRPLWPGEDSIAEGSACWGASRAILMWAALGRLISLGRLELAGKDPDEVDGLAAATFEVVGSRRRSN
jgi:hypothetical protein